ncbi:MAG: ABC transporter ATP-binding protein [Clostridia bacterium]|nr:ABC transporter ATP-binding protein [Clostridia bacterium]
MLKIEGLTRYYGSFLALDHLDLTIGDGELHGFVGPNGAGKTTTMRILATLLPASSGTASIDGAVIGKDNRKARSLVGYMPDFFGVYDNLKSWEYLDFYARCYGVRKRERLRMIEQLLELVGLTDKREAYVNSLSRGMKQRLCLAHALIHDPRLLILDEPASGMDPRARAEMKGILRSLKDMGKTVLVSSHILPELSEMCDSLTILDHGKLVFTGSVEALAQKMNGDAPLDIRFIPGCGDAPIDRAVTLLKENPLVTGITQEEPYLLRVRLHGEEDTCSAVLRTLIMDGLPIADFHRAPMNLEKVFMEVTQHA